MAVNQPMVDAEVYSASVGVSDGHLWCLLDGDDMVDRFELSDLDAVVACLEQEAVRRIATVVCTFSVEPPARIPTDESGVAVCLPTGDWVPYMGPESLQHRDIGVIQHPTLPISVPVDDSPPPPDFEWFSETTPAPEGAYSDFVDDAEPEPEPAPPAPEMEPIVEDLAAQPDDFLTGLGFDDAEGDLAESQEDIERWASGVLDPGTASVSDSVLRTRSASGAGAKPGRLWVVLAAILAVAVGVVAFVVWPRSTPPTHSATDKRFVTSIPSATASGASATPPGHDKQVWTLKVKTGTSFAATPDVVVVAEKDRLRFIDPNTGASRATAKAEGVVSAITSTHCGNGTAHRCVVWTTGKTGHVLDLDAPSVPATFTIPNGSHLLSRGGGVAWLGGDAGAGAYLDASEPTKPHVAALPVPPESFSYVYVGFDNVAVATSKSGAVWVRAVGSEAKSQPVKLKPPAPGLSFSAWVSATDKASLTLWSETPGASSGSVPVTFAIHDTATGTMKAAYEGTWGDLAHARTHMSPVTGLVTYGPFVVDLQAAKFVADGRKAGVRFGAVTGNLVSATDSDGGLLVLSGTTLTQIPGSIVALTGDDVAVVQEPGARISGYSPVHVGT